MRTASTEGNIGGGQRPERVLGHKERMGANG